MQFELRVQLFVAVLVLLGSVLAANAVSTARRIVSRAPKAFHPSAIPRHGRRQYSQNWARC